MTYSKVEHGNGMVIIPSRIKAEGQTPSVTIMLDEVLRDRIESKVMNKRWGLPALIAYALDKLEEEQENLLVMP